MRNILTKGNAMIALMMPLFVAGQAMAMPDSAFLLRFPLYVHTPYAFADRRIGFLPPDPRIPLPIGFRELWYLHVSGYLVRDDWDHLRAIILERQVPGLDFSRESNILTLQDLRGLTGLRLLNVAGTRINDRDLDMLWPMQGLEVFVANDRITDTGLARLGRHPRLVELGLAGSQVTDRGLAFLHNYSGLQRLDLSGTRVTDAGMVSLARLPLKQLALGAGITQQGIQALAGMKTLEQLDISQTHVGDEGYSIIMAWPCLHTLFAGRPLTDKGLERLSHVGSLRRLDLTGAHITDKGVQALGHLKDLEELALSQTAVGDAAIEAVVSLKALRFLEVSDTQVTDVGLQRLASMPSLQVISLSTTGSTDVSRFSAWRKLPRLHRVIINGRPMGYEWMQELRGRQARGLLEFQWVHSAEAAEDGSGQGIQVAQLMDNTPSGAGLSGLKRIHYVESELDDVIPAPTTIRQDTPEYNEKNFLGEIEVHSTPSGQKRPLKTSESDNQ
jgi:hypothetical protein